MSTRGLWTSSPGNLLPGNLTASIAVRCQFRLKSRQPSLGTKSAVNFGNPPALLREQRVQGTLETGNSETRKRNGSFRSTEGHARGSLGELLATDRKSVV